MPGAGQSLHKGKVPESFKEEVMTTTKNQSVKVIMDDMFQGAESKQNSSTVVSISIELGFTV